MMTNTNDIPDPIVMHPTMQLRRLKVTKEVAMLVPSPHLPGKYTEVVALAESFNLQQYWQALNGKGEWRDVEEVEEENEKIRTIVLDPANKRGLILCYGMTEAEAGDLAINMRRWLNSEEAYLLVNLPSGTDIGFEKAGK